MKEQIVIKAITVHDLLYEDMKALRHDVLRAPIGLALSADDCKDDKEHIQLALLCNNALIGCVLLRPKSDKVWQLRQMAIHPAHQQMGFGKMLVQEAELLLKSKGASGIILHGRKAVQNFYEKLGYKREGNEFIEVGIPHILMKKAL